MSPQLRLILGIFPPWFAASFLLGIICGALFFIVAGRRLLSLPLYLILGAVAAVVGQMASLGLELEPWPMIFGQVHLAATASAALLLLFVARLYRL